MTILMAGVAAFLFGCGTWLLLQRRLSRIVIGIGLLGHGANLLLVTAGGARGNPPFIGSADSDTFSDPLPQALALTAIVITFSVTAFLLAMGFRSWQLTRDDEVEDDVEDRLLARRERRDKYVEDVVSTEAGPGTGTEFPDGELATLPDDSPDDVGVDASDEEDVTR